MAEEGDETVISRFLCQFISAAVAVHAYRKYAPAMPPTDSLEMRACNELGNWTKCLDERDRRGMGEVPPEVVEELRRVTRGWRVGGPRRGERLN